MTVPDPPPGDEDAIGGPVYFSESTNADLVHRAGGKLAPQGTASGAMAELTRRHAEQMRKSGARLEMLTRVLIWLTVAIIALTVVLLGVALVAVAQS